MGTLVHDHKEMIVAELGLSPPTDSGDGGVISFADYI